MTLIAFKGKDRIHIFDRQDVKDDLLTQFNAAILFIEKHLNRRSIIKGVNREDIYEIPIEALREAVANAIIHRDYSMRGTSLTVEVYDDRVEITNPGGLPKGLQNKDFGRISVRRNELIADLFYRMDKVERAGTGIRRMKNAMEAAGLCEPEIEYNTFYTITLKRSSQEAEGIVKSFEKVGEKVGEKLTVNQRKIIEFVLQDKTISAKKLSHFVGISQRKIEQNISILKKKGYLKRIGPAKGGYRHVIDKL